VHCLADDDVVVLRTNRPRRVAWPGRGADPARPAFAAAPTALSAQAATATFTSDDAIGSREGARRAVVSGARPRPGMQRVLRICGTADRLPFAD
jgi:hypothetical protein